jgi:LEA14-like dessication related protein
MQNSKIPPWWVSHIRNDEVTNVTIDAQIQTSILGNRQFDLQQNQQVETDIIGQFNSEETRPVDGPSNPLYSNPVLYINETEAQWGSVSQQETPIDMAFTVYNPQSKPYAITEVGYEVTMNGIGVGEGATDRTYVIPGRASETIQTTPIIKNPRLDDWWVSHLQNDQVTQLRIDFYAKVELPTGQQIRVPLDALTYERTIETDIFGNKDEGGASTSGTATPTDGGSEPTATDGSTDTPTNSPVDSPVDSPTGSPLPGDATGTGTATDDDGLLGVSVGGLG